MARSAILFASTLLVACAAPAVDRGRDLEGVGDRDAELDVAPDATSGDGDRTDVGSADAGSDGKSDSTSLPPTAPRAVSCGTTHTCALSWAGDVRCWGPASMGSLGEGTMTGLVLVPSKPVLAGAEHVEAGNGQTCALVDGKVYCWGDGRFGILGDGNIPGPTTVTKPTLVPALSGARQIGALGKAVCTLMGDRTVRCWGWNLGHGLGYETGDCPAGDGTTAPCSAVPTTVPGVTDVGEISFGAQHACVRIRSSGAVWCWGENNYGQLGDGTTMGRWQARKVEGLPPVVHVSAAISRSCALTASGHVYCWGIECSRSSGLHLCGPVKVPTLVSGFAGPVIDLAAGADGGCALLADGRLQCWGSTDVVPFETKTPITMPGLEGVTAFCKPYDRTCAITKAGEMFCWGAALLGDGTTDATKGVPRKVVW